MGPFSITRSHPYQRKEQKESEAMMLVQGKVKDKAQESIEFLDNTICSVSQSVLTHGLYLGKNFYRSHVLILEVTLVVH